MALQQNTDHIQTTHIGSLPRPHRLLDILKAKYSGQTYDEKVLEAMLAQAVADCVRPSGFGIDGLYALDRHCEERSEAIQCGAAVLDCFVAPSGRLATTPLMQSDREMLLTSSCSRRRRRRRAPSRAP